MCAGLGVTDDDDVVGVPVFAEDPREVAPVRTVEQQGMAPTGQCALEICRTTENICQVYLSQLK